MFMVVSFPWPVASAYAGLVEHVSAGDVPVRHIPRRDDVAQPELVGAGRAR